MIFHREANGPRNLTKVTQESLGTLPVAEHRDRLSSVTSLMRALGSPWPRKGNTHR